MVRPSTAATIAALSLLVGDFAVAQTYRDAGGSVAPGVVPVGGDGSGPLFTSANPGKVAGILSASLGGFQPTPSYSAQSVTTASASYALPAGTVVVVYDTGASPITIKLGTSGVGVTAGQADVIQPGAWMAFTVGSATSYAVVGNGGPSTVVVSGGTGLPAGAGGGSGGGGGAVAQGAPNSAANAWPVLASVSGAAVSSSNPLPVTFGSGAALPAFASTPTVNIGSAPTLAVTGSFWQSTQPVSLAALPALSAGSNTIGKVNLLGAAGTGLDSAAGTANSQAVTIQGNSSGVAVPVSGSVTTSPKAGTFSSAACALNASTSTACIVSGSYNHATIQNLPGATASVACQWTNTSTSVTSSSLTNGGSVVLLPGQGSSWGPLTAGVPASTALYCIASAGTPSIYTEAN